MVAELKEFLGALGTTTGPYAFIAYLAIVVAWTYLRGSERRLKHIEANTITLIETQRARKEPNSQTSSRSATSCSSL